MTAVRRPRRGAILLVVLALLALFAVIGLSFVLYAESEATAARVYREAVASKIPPLDDTRPALDFLSGLVYGTTDPSSSLYGPDLARLLYGANGSIPYNGLGLTDEVLTVGTTSGGPAVINRRDVIHHALYQIDPLDPADPNNLVRPQTWVIVDPDYSRGDGQLRRGNNLATNRQAATAGGPNLAPALRDLFYLPRNAPYTYPDRNNPMLGLADPTTGQVVVPSAHRPQLFHPVAAATTEPVDWFGGPRTPSLAAASPLTNVNWINTTGRFKTLRPRRIDHLTTDEINTLRAAGLWPPPETFNDGLARRLSDPVAGDTTPRVGEFPYPPVNPDGSVTGDVQNLRLTDGLQRNDSVWVDAHLTPQLDPRGGDNPKTLTGKRMLVPVIAPLLLPLDNRIDLNAVGNLLAGGAHRSRGGFGPYEVNGTPVLSAATQAVSVRTGGAYQTPSLRTVLPFQPDPLDPTNLGRQTPVGRGSVLPYDASGGTGVQYANGLTGTPNFDTVYTDPGNAAANHPGLWNPYRRSPLVPPAATGPGTFPVSDLLLFGGKYATRVEDYTKLTSLGSGTTPQQQALQQSLLAGPVPPTLSTGLASPGNRVRQLVTPLANSLALPGLAPGNLTGVARLALNPALGPVPVLTTDAANATAGLAPALQVPQPGQPISPPNPTHGITRTTAPQYEQINQLLFDPTAAGDRVFSDNMPQPFGASGGLTTASNVVNRDARNRRAAVSGLDLNRPLADYRLNPTQPLTASNAGNAVAAANDRQAFARDIFLRLAIATHARIGYDPAVRPLPVRPAMAAGEVYSYYAPYVLPQPNATGGYDLTLPGVAPNTGYGALTNAVTPAEYDALRWLAQLAANIVDYLDPDDVSTTFVWNPAPVDTAPAVAPSLVGGPWSADLGTAHASYARNLDAAAPIPGDPFTGPPLGQRAVYGTEKPRLVINETLAMLANRENNANGPRPATLNNHQVRFFVELLNPGRREPNPNNVPGGGTNAVHPLAQPLSLLAINEPADPTRAAHDGAVPLVTLPPASGAPPEAVSGFRLVVSDNGGRARLDLRTPANVRGDLLTDDDGRPFTDPAAVPTSNPVRLVATVHDLAIADTTNSRVAVEPNNGSAQPGVVGTVGGAAGERRGFALVGPRRADTGNNQTDRAFNPKSADPTNDRFYAHMLTKPVDPNLQEPVSTIQNPNANSTAPRPARNGLVYEVSTGPSSGTPVALTEAEVTTWLNTYNATRQGHAVLLQRLANPYLPFNPPPGGSLPHDPAVPVNPYLTVDYVSRVRVQDGVTYANGTMNDHSPAPGYDTAWSAGRVEPLTGDEGDADNVNPMFALDATTTQAASLTLAETATPQGDHAAGVPPSVRASFFGHNSFANPAFQWLAHLDRKIVNPLELLHVGATKPHELTHRFALPAAAVAGAGGTTYHRHDLQHRRLDQANPASVASMAAPANVDGPLFAANSPLTRALELLSVKPWTLDQPYGGPVPGKVNLNLLFDERTTGTAARSGVFDGVLDPQAGDAFGDTDLTTIWAALKATRSPGWTGGRPVVGQTADDLGVPAGTNPALDRPFKGLGAGLVQPGTGNLPFVTQPAGSGFADTLFRPRNQSGGDQKPLFATVNPGQHPHQDWEAMRKVYNSVTTTTDGYLLVVTVGFFELREEVRDPVSGVVRRVLGKEYYEKVPGDKRKQFVAVLDRTGLTRPVNDDPANLRVPNLAAGADLSAFTVGDPAQPLSFGAGPNAGLNSRLLPRHPTTDYRPLPTNRTTYSDKELEDEHLSSLPWVVEAAAPTEVLLSTDPRLTTPRAMLPAPPRQAGYDNQVMILRLNAVDPPAASLTSTVDWCQPDGLNPFRHFDPTLTSVSVPLGIYGGARVKHNAGRSEYKDRPVTVTASVNPNLSGPTSGGAWDIDRNQGTRFFLGVGDRREVVEAIWDPSDVRTWWSYDAVNKVLKIAVRRPLALDGGSVPRPSGGSGPTGAATLLQPGVNTHPAGTAVSNASLGTSGPPTRPLDPLKTDAVVRYFGPLE